MKVRRLNIADLTVTQRLDLASESAKKLADYILVLIQTHANNRIIVYSDMLSNQIPESLAGNAFINFQNSMFAFELIRLMALWDRSSPDRLSIPTVLNLIDHPDVVALLRERYVGAWSNPPPMNFSGPDWTEEEKRRAVETSNRRMLDWAGARFDRALAKATRLAKAVNDSQRIKSLRDYRNHYLAHNLLPPPGYRSPKHGQERKLLHSTYHVANWLNGNINNSSFDYDGALALANQYAMSLWGGCKFTDIK